MNEVPSRQTALLFYSRRQPVIRRHRHLLRIHRHGHCVGKLTRNEERAQLVLPIGNCIMKDGTVRNDDGPRGKLCPVSHQTSLPDSAQYSAIDSCPSYCDAHRSRISPLRQLSPTPVPIPWHVTY